MGNVAGSLETSGREPFCRFQNSFPSASIDRSEFQGPRAGHPAFSSECAFPSVSRRPRRGPPSVLLMETEKGTSLRNIITTATRIKMLAAHFRLAAVRKGAS
ncbi:uncharacterized protein LOC116426465 isoform X2 [Nomia melanderi]|uniref:uncharacterized protein LOC116426465 isoform X2 n=1 Tax=Nomia melanderi TaxID=2448451 RepID=UPI003FCDDBB7